MVSATDLRLSGHKLSTVVPQNVTGDLVHELSNTDLAMKLHNLQAVYYFRAGGPAEGLGIMELKAPMFPLLDVYYPIAGRIRRDTDGRPYIKCNDSGVRIIEAMCEYEMEEWLEMEEHGRHWHLVSDKTLGPHLHFSPSVVIQFTRFKCGSLAVGLSWAHVLGDPVAATNFINLWGHILGGGNPPPKPYHEYHNKPLKASSAAVSAPLSIKQIESLGDQWIAPTSPQMTTFSIKIPEIQLKKLQVRTSTQLTPFEVLSAIIWSCIARIRGEPIPAPVTIIRNTAGVDENKFTMRNNMVVATVRSECSPVELELSELAMLIRKQAVDETELIEGGGGGGGDVLVYGARLTFVDMEVVEFDGLEMKGQKAIEVEFGVSGVGDGGAVLVRRGAGGGEGRVVTLMLVKEEMGRLREVLKEEWGIA